MSLELPTILSSTLGLCFPWKITDTLFQKEERRLDITVHFQDGKFPPCPMCGSEEHCCLTKAETWYHGSFLNYSTYLHAQVPHIECCGTLMPVERPWSRQGSKFVQVS